MHRGLAVIFALSSILVVCANSLFAADDVYPSKLVRLVVPTSAGGTQDLVARQIATKLSERLGKQVIVDNRGGAGQIIGTEIVAKADPDGYTLLLPAGVHSIQASLLKLPYDAIKSFTPIALMSTVSFALVVHPSVPARSVKELIALAKQKPGQLIFAATGIGVTPHMATELFRMLAGIDITIVHFKGQGPTIPDLLGGHSNASINSIPAFLPHIKSGKLRVLGTTATKRTVAMPEVPTIAEAGLPGYETTSWYGILAPAGTPAPIVDRLNKELTAILALDEIRKFFVTVGLDMNHLGPTDFARFIEDAIKSWERVVKAANIKAE